MNILVVGSGGREHALAWKLSLSPNVEQVYVAPGNAGTALENKISNVDIPAHDIHRLADFADTQDIALTVIGPEVPLVEGIVDLFTLRDLTVLGADQYAAQLEGSKAFAKQFMQDYGIPTAAYAEFTDADAAKNYLTTLATPIVIKADGLAAGKGVVITSDLDKAAKVIDTMLSGELHGQAGRKIIIEEFLSGEEASFICVIDGQTILPLATSQDHKARDDGDQGPNTGGMGAYSPTPLITPELHQRVMNTVIHPVVSGMQQRGHVYRGFLYAGLMIADDSSINVLEFNCRFGDPETQPILMRLQSDFAELCLRAATSQLQDYTARWDPRCALTVVMASSGYPERYQNGLVISGLNEPFNRDTKIFHAGTRADGNKVLTSGGRVLGVTALGDDIVQAQTNAYRAVSKISWPGAFYRRDIGYRAIQKRQAN